MQINFKTYERIVKNKIEETKQKYYFDKFTSQKNDMKKTWATIDETLNRKRKYLNESYICNCMRISAKIIYYVRRRKKKKKKFV